MDTETNVNIVITTECNSLITFQLILIFKDCSYSNSFSGGSW